MTIPFLNLDFLFSLAANILTVLRARLDVKFLAVHDNDTQLGHPAVSGLVESYGHFVSAILYTVVEVVACLNFALRHRLQGSRKHLLPVVNRRAQATLHAVFKYISGCLLTFIQRLSRTSISVSIMNRLAPCAAVLSDCHDEIRDLFGDDCVDVAADYLGILLRRALAFLSGTAGSILDSIARSASRSTLLWMMYMPIAVWFSLTLCTISISLAFLSPYTFYEDVAPSCGRVISNRTARSSRLPIDVADAKVGVQSATLLDANIYSADSSNPQPPPSDTSNHSAIEESPSLDLSTLLADMDPHIDTSALVCLEMRFVPDIYITPADQSTAYTCPSSSFSPDLRDDALDEGSLLANDYTLFNDDHSTASSRPSSSCSPRLWDDALDQGSLLADDCNNIAPIAEDTIAMSTPDAADTSLANGIEQVTEQVPEHKQAGNTEAMLSNSEFEMLEKLLLGLDAREASGAFRPYVDSEPTRSYSSPAAPCSNPPVSEAVDTRDIFDLFMDSQAQSQVPPADSKLYSVHQRLTPEVVIRADDALLYASAKAGAAYALQLTKQVPTPAEQASSVPGHMRTEGAENRPIPAFWSPGRSGPVPIVAPPNSRRRKNVPGVGGALATGDKRKDYLIRRALT